MSLKMGPGRAAAAPELNLHWQIRAAPAQDHGPNESGPPFSGGVGSTIVDGWRTRQGQFQSSSGSGQADTQVAQLTRFDGRGSAGHQVGCGGRLRERHDVADRFLASQQSDDAIEAEGDPAVWRRAVVERLEQEPEALPGLVLRQADRVEDLLLDLGRVDTNEAAADLGPAQHDGVPA